MNASKQSHPKNWRLCQHFAVLLAIMVTIGGEDFDFESDIISRLAMKAKTDAVMDLERRGRAEKLDGYEAYDLLDSPRWLASRDWRQSPGRVP